MKTRSIWECTAFFFSLGIFLLAANSAHAQTVVLPPSMQIQGLTLEGPLSLDENQQIKSPAFISSVSFSLTPPLFLNSQPSSNSANLNTLIDRAPTVVAPESTDTEEPTPAPTMKPKIKPTAAPTEDPTTPPAPTATPTSTPTPAPQSASIPENASGGLNASLLFSMVQNYRQQNNLPPFQVDQRACEVAEARAPQVQEEIDDGHMHSGLKAMNLPYWNTENIITMRTEQEAFNWWINDPIHHEAIVGNYKYSCLACSGNACAEEFTDFTPK